MDWSTWKAATCLPECWCEAARVGKWILEPVNTWTNLPFILAGLYLLLFAKRQLNGLNALTTNINFPRIYGFALLFVGLGSFFYHASQTFIGQWFDVFGMYLVSFFYIYYNFYRTNCIRLKVFHWWYWSTCTALGVIIWYYPESRRYLFGMSLAFAAIQTIIIQYRYAFVMKTKYFYGAILAYAIAQTFWILDKNKIWCDPYALMNGHGLWHILNGIAALLVYWYFASQTTSEKSPSV